MYPLLTGEGEKTIISCCKGQGHGEHEHAYDCSSRNAALT